MRETKVDAAAVEVVYRWDLDKTYLQTEFSTLDGLLRAALEGATRKRTVPGTRALLAALSSGRSTRVIVVSGSPLWLRRRIVATFKLHGIRCDRLVLKDYGHAMRRGRVRALTAQVPFKMRAHLASRLWLAAQDVHAGEVCFGDDSEVDALIYCLYADVCARRVSASRLADILRACDAYDDEVAAILGKLALVERHDPVRRVFIHLDGNSPPARFGAYRGRVTATFNAFQIALSLVSDGLADDTVLIDVAEDLANAWRFDAEALAGSLEDATRRGLCSQDLAVRVATSLLPRTAAFDVGFDGTFAARVGRRIEALRDLPEASDVNHPLPYEQLFEAEQGFVRARKLARKTAGRIPGLSDFLGTGDDPGDG